MPTGTLVQDAGRYLEPGRDRLAGVDRAAAQLALEVAARQQRVAEFEGVHAAQAQPPIPVARRAQRLELHRVVEELYIAALAGALTFGAMLALGVGWMPKLLMVHGLSETTANFGAWCLSMQQTLPVQVQISQGEFVGRPSTLFLEVNRQAQVFVGGDVLEIGRGSVTL